MPSDDNLAFDLARAFRQSRMTRKRGNQYPDANPRRAPSTCTSSQPSAGRSHTQQIGDGYETRAVRLLSESGCEILGRQLHCRFGEIDIAVREGTTLVFVEVRSCKNMQYGGAIASVGTVKQKRLIRAARWWMQALIREHFAGMEPTCRFDLIAFESDRPVWIRDAFCVT